MYKPESEYVFFFIINFFNVSKIILNLEKKKKKKEKKKVEWWKDYWTTCRVGGPLKWGKGFGFGIAYKNRGGACVVF